MNGIEQEHGRRDQRLPKSAKVAFALLGLGVLPIGAIECGLYRVGMCDPTPLLALGWLELLSLIGIWFGFDSISRAKAQGGVATIPVLAAVLNLVALLLPILILVGSALLSK